MSHLNYEVFEPGTYLYRFFSEKELEVDVWEIEDSDGVLHIIDSEVVLEHIAITGPEERSKIEMVLRKLDFHNADITDFLKHLAKGIVAQWQS